MERISIYQSLIKTFEQKKQKLRSKRLRLSLIRLIVFLTCLAGIYLFWSTTLLVVGFVFVFILAFIVLVKMHAECNRELKKIKLLIEINQNEIKALDGNYNHFKNGVAYKNPEHAFAEDIDLFGEKSFFQFINRTGLSQGEMLLANWLKSNDINNIKDKQNAIKELADHIEFRQNFTAEAKMLENQDELNAIVKALEQHQNFVPKSFRYLGLFFSGLSLAIIGLYAFSIINTMQLLLWIFIGLGITGFYLKKINVLSHITSKAQELFRQYQKLINAVELEHFDSELLKTKQSQLSSKNQKASEAIKSLSKHIDALEQRQNLMVGFVFNAFLLWDLQQSYKIEQWLNTHKNDLKQWFDIMAFFDAQNALANLAYNQTTYTFPSIDHSSKLILDCKSSTHPLIPTTQAVTNDFQVMNEDFLIITGANMAGKSTFLRTVSLMIVMANLGLPVCASHCNYKPIKLITSMRTSDSLSDESSYFFSELSRLKTIIEHLKTDTYFIVLDEILKGTNSHDKAKGSKQFIEKLVNTNSTGIIATHDLSLCELSDQLKQVHNFYFDAEIINDELHFDYKFKKGVCQNMNASFLLKKMGIV
ncbi:MutS-related protein [Flavobacteriaceae bacterium 14752]|uniref:MutS-related protein n=1 Tax=Mesohalobacter salilacus TaxID=2491711 RepID=UPI000F638434|nr:DNA mismatch repair protein MutS [Flavobacteriaceae bacterium 14752]